MHFESRSIAIGLVISFDIPGSLIDCTSMHWIIASGSSLLAEIGNLVLLSVNSHHPLFNTVEEKTFFRIYRAL